MATLIGATVSYNPPGSRAETPPFFPSVILAIKLGHMLCALGGKTGSRGSLGRAKVVPDNSPKGSVLGSLRVFPGGEMPEDFACLLPLASPKKVWSLFKKVLIVFQYILWGQQLLDSEKIEGQALPVLLSPGPMTINGP